MNYNSTHRWFYSHFYHHSPVQLNCLFQWIWLKTPILFIKTYNERFLCFKKVHTCLYNKRNKLHNSHCAQSLSYCLLKHDFQIQPHRNSRSSISQRRESGLFTHYYCPFQRHHQNDHRSRSNRRTTGHIHSRNSRRTYGTLLVSRRNLSGCCWGQEPKLLLGRNAIDPRVVV